MSRTQILNYFALGFGCCIAVLAIAALAALAVVNTGGDPIPGAATPTPLQLKDAMEFIGRNAAPQTGSSSTGGAGFGGGGGGAAGAQATSTPATPEVRLGGGTTQSVPQSIDTGDATPKPTTTSGSNLTVPTRVPFTPPTIVLIQPLLPTPSSAPPPPVVPQAAP